MREGISIQRDGESVHLKVRGPKSEIGFTMPTDEFDKFIELSSLIAAGTLNHVQFNWVRTDERIDQDEDWPRIGLN